jgi:hypothetical protein
MVLKIAEASIMATMPQLAVVAHGEVAFQAAGE